MIRPGMALPMPEDRAMLNGVLRKGQESSRFCYTLLIRRPVKIVLSHGSLARTAMWPNISTAARNEGATVPTHHLWHRQT